MNIGTTDEIDVKFCYRLLLKTREALYVIAVAKDLPSIRSHISWIDENIQATIKQFRIPPENYREIRHLHKNRSTGDVTLSTSPISTSPPIYKSASLTSSSMPRPEDDAAFYLIAKFESLGKLEKNSEEYIEYQEEIGQLRLRAISSESSLSQSPSNSSSSNTSPSNSRMSSLSTFIDKVKKRRGSKHQNPYTSSVTYSFTVGSLEELLEDAIGVTYYLQFHLQERINPYNLLLWMDIDVYKNQTLTENSRVSLATKIYEKYLQEEPVKAPNFIYIEPELKKLITLEMVSQNPSTDLFDRIQKWLIQIMFLETFHKFLGHKLYLQYLERRDDRQEEELEKAALQVSWNPFDSLT